MVEQIRCVKGWQTLIKRIGTLYTQIQKMIYESMKEGRMNHVVEVENDGGIGGN